VKATLVSAKLMVDTVFDVTRDFGIASANAANAKSKGLVARAPAGARKREGETKLIRFFIKVLFNLVLV